MNEEQAKRAYDPTNLGAPSLNAIEFRNATKRFGSKTALDSVSFAVKPGSVFALLGENGAGKTTAIRTILGELATTSGEVEVFQLDPYRKIGDIRNKIGFVPESPVLYEYMTVEEHGRFASAFYPKGYMARYAELCVEFQLSPYDKIGALSKGMKAKVSLALALAHDPELLVLDEPTSGLDILVRKQFLMTMATLASEGRTVFLSCHQVNEVERVADTVALMKNGKIVLVEPLESLKNSTQIVTTTVVGHNADEQLDKLFSSIFTEELIGFERFGAVCTAVGRGLRDNFAECLRAALGERLTNARVARPTLEDVFLAYMRQ